MSETAPLMLAPHQVPRGATVRVIDPDTGRPLAINGQPADALIKLISVGSMAVVFCTVSADGRVGGAAYDQVPAGTLFTPVEVYSVAEAPAGREYAVFVDGERWQFVREVVNVIKQPSGQLVLKDDVRLTVPVPAGAVLVPVDEQLPAS